MPQPQVNEATLVRGTVAFGAISGAYASVIAAGTNLRYLRLRNSTDAALIVSFNNSTDHLDIAVGATEVLDLASLGLCLSKGVFVKDAGVAATSGNFTALGGYSA